MKQLAWACLLLTAAFAAGPVHAASSREMSVQVKDGQIRATPTFLGQIVAPVRYGDRVTVLEEKAPWVKISVEGKSGWIHSSALTPKRITLRAGDQNVQSGASGDELALAGKGFNSDVEAQFKAQNKDIDFTWVDKMEKWTVDPKEMQRFLQEGGVKPSEGGGR